jgi:hypothetical protein
LHALIGVAPQSVTGKIKDELVAFVKNFPDSSRVKCWFATPGLKTFLHLNPDVDVRVTFRNPEYVEFGTRISVMGGATVNSKNYISDTEK